jgi:spoIIIJ-associated protein
MSEDLLALAKLRLEEMLAFFGETAAVKVTEADGVIETKVDVDSTGRLIGHHGETLAALQHLLNALVRAQTTESVYVSLDIAGYKQAQIERLAAKAKEYADRAISTGKEQYLRPMSPAERRIVHMTLATFPEITTESTGEGRDRRVIIRPRSD